MHPLTRDVIYATALRREIAKPAIACALLFLRSALTAEDIAQFVDRIREQVTAALRNSGGIKVVERLVCIEEQGCSDVTILARRLLNLGLNPAQILRLVDEVITYTETLAGGRSAKEFHEVLPALAGIFEALSQSTE